MMMYIWYDIHQMISHSLMCIPNYTQLHTVKPFLLHHFRVRINGVSARENIFTEHVEDVEYDSGVIAVLTSSFKQKEMNAQFPGES